jgi:methylthioribulose-1-phosphate dehydratase
MNQIELLKEGIASTIRDYNSKGWSPATSTNYSFKFENSDIFVSRSGVDKSKFNTRDFITVNNLGKPTGEFIHSTPSAETLIHCVLYDLFPDTRVILHSHSVYTVLNAQRYDSKISLRGYEIQKGFAGQTTHEAEIFIPIFENTQNMVEFSQWMIDRKEEIQVPCFVIRNHGAYAWGNNLFEAKRHLETLEYLMEVDFKANRS